MAEPNQPNDAHQPQPVPETGVIATPPAAPPASVSAGAPPAKAAAPPKQATPSAPTRRNFLVVTALVFFGSWFAAAWTTFTLSMLGLTLGTVRLMFPND